MLTAEKKEAVRRLIEERPPHHRLSADLEQDTATLLGLEALAAVSKV
jgi:hypothetical protein